VDPGRNPEPVTLQDPCHLVRKGGVSRPQRDVIERVCLDFREMWPHGEHNFCCGGGGGLLLGGRRSETLAAGRVKAKQIADTGARIVVTPCHNCRDQIQRLSAHYDLGVEVIHLWELIDRALAVPGKVA